MKNALLIGGIAGGLAYAVWARGQRQAAVMGEEYSLMDQAQTALDELAGAISAPTPVAGMRPSPALREMLKRREKLSLTRYELGDGGYTWGWGHFETSPTALPMTITRQHAEQLFDQDLEARAAKWVRLYVKVPLTQNQFDALVHIAFNMSPRSFKKFADQVNAGQGIEAIASQSVTWVAAHLRRGIQNRRDEELALFNSGVYA